MSQRPEMLTITIISTFMIRDAGVKLNCSRRWFGEQGIGAMGFNELKVEWSQSEKSLVQVAHPELCCQEDQPSLSLPFLQCC